MKLIIALCIFLALFTQVESKAKKTYNRLTNCYYVCDHSICDGLYGDSKPNAQEEAICKADADAYRQCFNGFTLIESCLRWKEHLKHKSREDFNETIDWDYIKDYRDCSNQCGSLAQSTIGQEYVKCRLNCYSSILTFSLAVLAIFALLF